FHTNKVHYQISDPLVRFHHAILRPCWSELERPGRAAEVWAREQRRFLTQVLGPTFERMCRDWSASPDGRAAWGAPVEGVRIGRVSDPDLRETREIDVVVTG